MKDKIFGVLQRVGRSFMLPIALLPVAGLLLGIGSSFTNPTTIETYNLTNIIKEGGLLYTILDIMSKTGSAVFDNLALLFAMGVAIGMAKKDLEKAAERIDAILKLHRGKAFVSINKALVTQASSAIPVVPLYVSILYKVMKEKGIHQDSNTQIQRLFATQLYNDNFLDFDDAGRVRIDNLELRDDVQKEVFEIWPKVNTQNLNELTDFAGYKSEFMKLFGFGRPDIDYSKDVEI